MGGFGKVGAGIVIAAFVAAFTVTLVDAALIDNPPFPRKKPAKIKALAKSAKKKIVKVPLPRPRPFGKKSKGKKSARAKLNVPSAITKGRGGRLDVSLPGLGRERNPDSAAELQASVGSTWSRSAIREAKLRCDVVLATTNVEARQLEPKGGPDGCGIAVPVRVTAFGAVSVTPPAIMNCTLAAALYKWVIEELQPAARKYFKQPVISMRNASAYSCRSRRGEGTAGRISEHSFGNALDIADFTLATGQTVSILDHWKVTGFAGFFGGNDQSRFLNSAHKGACSRFSTVLGPEYNKAHDNHFHFDLGRSGRNKICK